MHFDDLLRHVGEFGPYQKRMYVLLVIPTMFTAFQVMSPVFIMGEQTYWCDMSDINTTESRTESLVGIQTVNRTLLDQCTVTQYEYEDGVSANSTRPCDSWKYDTTVYTSTVVSQFNMICDRTHLQSLAKMTFFFGCVLAACVEGSLGDIFGRKKIYTISFIALFMSSIALPWVPNVITFVILRFLIGFSNFGVFNMGIIMGLEIVGPSKRIWSGVAIELVFCIGEVLLCGAAYLIRDWKILQLVVSAPSVICLIYWFLLYGGVQKSFKTYIILYLFSAYSTAHLASFIPESPRWLLLEGKQKEAMAILDKIAKSNKKELPVNAIEVEREQGDTFRKSIVLIFKSKTLFLRLTIMSFGWFVISMTYYGITYNVGRIGGNVYINFMLSVIVEFLGYSICIVLSEKLGRKVVHCGSLLIAGVACITTIFTTLYATQSFHWITIALSNVGKCCISTAFANVFLYTSELFPTGVRGFSLSTCNMASRIGAMVSPYIADLSIIVKSDAGKALPLVIFGAIAAIVGFLSLILPETVRTKLPQNVAEATKLQKYSTEIDIDNCVNDAPFKLALLQDKHNGTCDNKEVDM